MRVSVCYPIKNPDGKLKQSIAKVLRQIGDFDTEIILINSNPSNPFIASDFSTSRIKTVNIRPQDFGHGKTRNLVLDHASSEFIVFLTQDAVPKNNEWLNELIAPFKEDRLIVGTFSRHAAHAEHPSFVNAELDLHFDFHKEFGSLRKLNDEISLISNQAVYFQALHFFSNNSSCVRRSYFSNHPFKEVDFSEDQIWAKEALENGMRLAYADKSIVFHSHFFSGFEAFRRAIDEGQALKSAFGYEVVSSTSHLLRHAYALSKRRVKANDKTHKHRQKISNFDLIFSALLEAVGYWLGARISPTSLLLSLLSRDRRIQRAKSR